MQLSSCLAPMSLKLWFSKGVSFRPVGSRKPSNNKFSHSDFCILSKAYE